mmetsp:Transcript_102566/g.299212  ORF Transcript_102566/g.299212 Transcript_102566/m.299212 type:complete len:372 (-) Transcript_102566:383-1498(-)
MLAQHRVVARGVTAFHPLACSQVLDPIQPRPHTHRQVLVWIDWQLRDRLTRRFICRVHERRYPAVLGELQGPSQRTDLVLGLELPQCPSTVLLLQAGLRPQGDAVAGAHLRALELGNPHLRRMHQGLVVRLPHLDALLVQAVHRVQGADDLVLPDLDPDGDGQLQRQDVVAGDDRAPCHVPRLPSLQGPVDDNLLLDQLDRHVHGDGELHAVLHVLADVDGEARQLGGAELPHGRAQAAELALLVPEALAEPALLEVLDDADQRLQVEEVALPLVRVPLLVPPLHGCFSRDSARRRVDSKQLVLHVGQGLRHDLALRLSGGVDVSPHKARPSDRGSGALGDPPEVAPPCNLLDVGPGKDLAGVAGLRRVGL